MKDIGSNIRLFADDTSVYIIVDDPVAAAELLNLDLDKITKWAKEWLVKFNPNKTESLLISRNIYRPFHPPLSMLDQQITDVESHKHLGIYLSNDCTWHKHIEYIKEKAWNRINVMRKLKFELNRQTLETIYLTFFRPVLENANKKEELEKIQNEAARIVTGTTKLVSIHALYEETGWDTLDSRRRKHKLTLFYKMYTNQTPPYLSTLVPPSVNTFSEYSLRNSNDTQTIHARTTLYYNSFFFLNCQRME